MLATRRRILRRQGQLWACPPGERSFVAGCLFVLRKWLREVMIGFHTDAAEDEDQGRLAKISALGLRFGRAMQRKATTILGGASADVSLATSSLLERAKSIAQGVVSRFRAEVPQVVVGRPAELVVQDLVTLLKGALSAAQAAWTTAALGAWSEVVRGIHQATGARAYLWVTMKDDRVREMHADLEGTIQTWDNPPVTNPRGDRNHPGEDWNCRCVAVPVPE